MLRAWRINRYGTTDAKAIRQDAANRPRGKAAKSASKTPSTDKRQGQGVVTAGGPQTSDCEQALHPEGSGPEEDPQAHQ